jgi:hypothetical protein
LHSSIIGPVVEVVGSPVVAKGSVVGPSVVPPELVPSVVAPVVGAPVVWLAELDSLPAGSVPLIVAVSEPALVGPAVVLALVGAVLP